MALSERDRIRLLEEIAGNESLKATQRLRALEELGRIEARRAPQSQDPKAEEVPPDPMADLQEQEDELESRRRRRRVG